MTVCAEVEVVINNIFPAKSHEKPVRISITKLSSIKGTSLIFTCGALRWDGGPAPRQVGMRKCGEV